MRSYGTSVFESLKVDWFFSIDPEDQGKIDLHKECLRSMRRDYISPYIN